MCTFSHTQQSSPCIESLIMQYRDEAISDSNECYPCVGLYIYICIDLYSILFIVDLNIQHEADIVIEVESD